MYVINLDAYSDIGTHRLLCTYLIIMLLILIGLEYNVFPKKIKEFIDNKNIKTNIYRIQAYDLIIWGYYCIQFIDFTLSGKTLTYFANLSSPNNVSKTMIKFQTIL